ncbi:MAG: hypothetical protein R3F33_00270 [Planctomycetota bacterium]
MKVFTTVLALQAVFCSQPSPHGDVAVAGRLYVGTQDSEPAKEGSKLQKESQQKEWFDYAGDLAVAPCEYEVEVKWTPFRIPETRDAAKGAANELETVLLGEGEVEPVYESLAASVAALWKVRLQEANHTKPGRYRISRGQGKVLQYCLTTPANHFLRTPDLAITCSFPPGQIVVEKRDDRVSLFEPQTILHPLPWGDGLAKRRKLDWVQVGERLFRAEENSTVRTTVLLDDLGRPVACWIRLSKDPDIVYAGFYKWHKTENGTSFPLSSIALRGQEGAVHVMMHDTKLLSLNDPRTEPLLVLNGPCRVIDGRGAKPKYIPQPFPEFLKGLVDIKKD